MPKNMDRPVSEWYDRIADVDMAKISVNKKTDEALKDVQEMKEKKPEISGWDTGVRNEATKKHIIEIKATKAKSIQKLNKKRKNIQDKKSGIEREIEKMEEQLEIDNPSQIIQLSREPVSKLEKILRDSAYINNNDILVKVPIFAKPDLQDQRGLQPYGAASERQLKMPKNRWVPIPWDRLDFKLWEHTLIAGNNEGMVLVYGMEHDGMVALKCFKIDGVIVWEKEFPQDEHCLSGISFVSNGDRKFIATSDCNSDTITLRKASDGSYVTHSRVNFSPGQICFDCWDDGYILAQDYCQVKDLFVARRTSIDTSMVVEVTNCHVTPYSLRSATAFCLARGVGDRMMYVLSSWQSSTIQAIDPVNGEILWEVTGKYEGKMICPCGMGSTRFGTIYVADGTNNRILKLNSAGKIERCQVKTPGTAYNVHLINCRGHLKLVVLHEDATCKSEAITSYKIYCEFKSHFLID